MVQTTGIMFCFLQRKMLYGYDDYERRLCSNVAGRTEQEYFEAGQAPQESLVRHENQQRGGRRILSGYTPSQPDGAGVSITGESYSSYTSPYTTTSSVSEVYLHTVNISKYLQDFQE